MSNYRIAVIGGDGTGPEVVREGVKVLTALQDLSDIQFEFQHFDFGGDRYMSTGEILSDSDIATLQMFDAIYLGAIGHPDVLPGILEKGILLKLRFDLDQYINLRPVRLYENVSTPIKDKTHEDIDYVVVRENTGGLYSGVGGFSMKGTPQEVASQSMVYSHFQVERCVRYAFETAKRRHVDAPWKGLSDEDKETGYIGQLTLCGKTNVLTYVFDLWDRVFHSVAKEFPMIKPNYVHVDAACIYMIESPHQFDVIVTGNMFGDIITDLAAVTQGGMGVAASGNINPKGVSMFEPIGGTAPNFTGTNQINPMAAIGAAHMMLDHLGEFKLATQLELAKIEVIKKMSGMGAGQMGVGTDEVGDLVVGELRSFIVNTNPI